MDRRAAVAWTQLAARGFPRPSLSNCISFLPAEPLRRTGYLNGGTGQRETSVTWSLAWFSCRPIPKPQLRFVLSPLLPHSKTSYLCSGLVLPFWQVLVCKKSSCNFHSHIFVSEWGSRGLQPSFRRLQYRLELLVTVGKGAALTQNQPGSWCWAFMDTQQPKCQKRRGGERKNLFKQFFSSL